MAVHWDLDDEPNEQPTVASPIEPVVSGDCAATLLKEFDLYSQDNTDYMGSPFRKRVLQAIKEYKVS